MAPDERLGRITRRRHALAESLQLLTRDVQSLTAFRATEHFF